MSAETCREVTKPYKHLIPNLGEERSMVAPSDDPSVTARDMVSHFDSESPADKWSVVGDFLCIKHVVPRVDLFIPDETNCPFPLRFIGINRLTETSLLSDSESKIRDLWDPDAPGIPLSGEWTGKTCF